MSDEWVSPRAGSINEPPGSNVLARDTSEIAPAIEGLNPNMAMAGTANQLVVVHGKNFQQGCVITFDGKPQTTTFERADKINAKFALTDIVAGDYPVTVKHGDVHETLPTMFTVTENIEASDDPDDIEDELEQLKEEGDVTPVRRKPTGAKHGR